MHISTCVCSYKQQKVDMGSTCVCSYKQQNVHMGSNCVCSYKQQSEHMGSYRHLWFKAMIYLDSAWL